MLRFSSNYKKAKDLYDFMCLKQQEYEAVSVDKQEGYARFLGYLFTCNEFKTMYDAEEDLGILASSEDVLEKAIRPIESFCAFFGKTKVHKVWILFNVQEDIWLQKIMLVYHEEMGRDSFWKTLEEVSFYKDPPARSRKKRLMPA